MPLIQSTVDALPYIDPSASGDALAAAHALIQAKLPPTHDTTLHPSIPALRSSSFSASIQTEHARLAAGQPASPGIDLTRYEALSAPPAGSTAAWKAALQQAYTSAEYLRGREVNLGLLETYGRNAWLVGNSQLEDVLGRLEREVEDARRELEGVEQGRRAMQAGAAGEMVGLEEAWRKGVGRMLETQAAAEGLRGEILERRRRGAV